MAYTGQQIIQKSINNNSIATQTYNTLKPKTDILGVVWTFRCRRASFSTSISMYMIASVISSVSFYMLKEFGLLGSTSHHWTELIIVDSSILWKSNINYLHFNREDYLELQTVIERTYVVCIDFRNNFSDRLFVSHPVIFHCSM